MKNYEEMARSVLERSNNIINKRNKRRKTLAGVVVAAVACFVVVVIAHTISNGGIDWAKPTVSPNNGNANLNSVREADVNWGLPFRYIKGSTYIPSGTTSAILEPQFEFSRGFIDVVAKAVEEYPGIYSPVTSEAIGTNVTYRLFKMVIIDSLDSGMKGEFYYLLPSRLDGDLTEYDSLLISMLQMPANFILKKDNKILAFDYIFTDPYGIPELGNIIAFTNGVFDETLWQEDSWYNGYKYEEPYLDKEDDEFRIVYRGATLEKVLAKREKRLRDYPVRINWASKDPSKIQYHSFANLAAQEAMNYIRSLENGVYVPNVRFSISMGSWLDVLNVEGGEPYYTSRELVYYRLINGCLTNERIRFDCFTEEVVASEFKFEEADVENLPDISQYIANLDLSDFSAQHTDEKGKELVSKTVYGWYEKTSKGVYSIVKIGWKYYSKGEHAAYYDATFILLDENGAMVISPEDLVALIGENRHIRKYSEYGEAFILPMA